MPKRVQAGPQAHAARTPRSRKVAFSTIACVLIIVVCGFALWPGTPLDLGIGHPLRRTQVYQRWQAGEVIVLVRHAERCDRSAHPCLGPADGITRLGDQTASSLGQAFRTIGMQHTDVLSSPLTRTLQTAQSMFNQPATTRDWLVNCGANFPARIKAQKRQGRNLILVTHSACISNLESQLGFSHAVASEYTSSLFVTLRADGQLKILGIINAKNWPQALK